MKPDIQGPLLSHLPMQMVVLVRIKQKCYIGLTNKAISKQKANRTTHRSETSEICKLRFVTQVTTAV